MDIEYWKNRYRSDQNYDTMTGWSKDTITDETANLSMAIMDFLGQNVWRKVIDFGCGKARFYPLFDMWKLDYVGTDILKELIDDNRKLYPHINFKYMSDYSKTDIDDLVFMFTVFQYFTDEEVDFYLGIEFKESRDIFICESLASPGALLRAHEHNRQPDEIKKIAEKNGWKVKKEMYFNGRERYYFLWLIK
jgi:SAM-dependent methyltransferase